MEAIRQRHDGAARNPWNEMECGDHYARAMASYGLLQAYARSAFDQSKGRVTLWPQMNGARFATFFAVDGAWGSVQLGHGELTISLGGGQLEVRELEVNGHAVSLDGPATITPEQPLHLQVGI